MSVIAIFIILIFLHSLVCGRLEKTILTAPIMFTGAGMLLMLSMEELHAREVDLGLWLQIAEVGLVLLLFTDASHTDLHVLKNGRSLPMRIRQGLNVEAGLNDGLSVPFLLFFIALAGASGRSRRNRQHERSHRLHHVARDELSVPPDALVNLRTGQGS